MLKLDLNKPLNQNLILIKRTLQEIPLDKKIETELDKDFHYMEGTGNPMTNDTKLVTRAKAYGLVTEMDAIQLFVNDAVK